MPFCPACGKEASSEAKYCPSCGASLKGQAATIRKSQPNIAAIRELKTRHIILTALFGLFYAVPASILLFRNNNRAVRMLLFGGLLELFILLILGYLGGFH